MRFHSKYYIFIVFLLISCNNRSKKVNETVIFGGGCFWTLDYYFEKVEGVKEVSCIYTGSGSEAVSVLYDPAQVSFEKLCRVFMGIHAPETNYKPRYRSVIQTNNKDHFQTALRIIEDIKKIKDIKTTVEKIDEATKPDDMHEDWHKLKNSEPKCHLPEKSFEEFLKSLN